MIYFIPYIFIRLNEILFLKQGKKELLSLMEEGKLCKNKFIDCKDD
jgi:hypothetical protein